jgi:RNA polymerase sigma-70 factor (sigma-E family)
VSSRAAALTSARQRIGELYARHAPEAARLAYLLTGDKELAEDLVQEAFVKMLGRFEDLRKPESFRAYLRRTVVNLSKKHWRRLAVERRYVRVQGSLRSPEEVRFPDVATSDAMWSVVTTLPTRQRAAIVLRFYEDLSEHQTAEMLGCSAGAVKSLIARAMESLRATGIAEEGSDGI